MKADKIEVKYEELAKIANLLYEEAERYQILSQKITGQVDNLTRTRFRGKAADQFHEEMENLVLPGVKRLSQSLITGQESLEEIIQLFMNAEQNAADLFGKDHINETNLSDIINFVIDSGILVPFPGFAGAFPILLPVYKNIFEKGILPAVSEIGENFKNGNWELLPNFGSIWDKQNENLLTILKDVTGIKFLQNKYLGPGIGAINDIAFSEDPNIVRRVFTGAGSNALTLIPHVGVAMGVNSIVQGVGQINVATDVVMINGMMGYDVELRDSMLAMEEVYQNTLDRANLKPILDDATRLAYDQYFGDIDFKKDISIAIENPSFENILNISKTSTKLLNRLSPFPYGSITLNYFQNDAYRTLLNDDAIAVVTDIGNAIFGLNELPTTYLQKEIVKSIGTTTWTMDHLPLPDSWQEAYKDFALYMSDQYVNQPRITNLIPEQRVY